MRHIDLWGNAPGNNPYDRLLCSIDPVSAILGGVLSGAAGLFGGGKGGGSTVVNNTTEPTPAPAPPPPASAPQGVKPGTKSKQPSFVGGVGGPTGGLDSGGPIRSGQKTLLGQ